MEYSLIYVTSSSYGEALKIGKAVVEARLAACANILGSITSVYWEQNKIQEEHEVALLLKTRTTLVEQVITLVCMKHSYKCPCVVALPLTAGHSAFLEWIKIETCG